MPGSVIGKSMNLGFPGTISRNGDCVIDPRQVTATDATGPAFGDPLVGVNTNPGGTWSSVADYIAAGGTFTAAKFGGIAVREVKSFGIYQPTPAFARYLPGEYCDGLQRGSAPVKINVGTPSMRGAVYVRVLANAAIPAGVVGGFEAAADGTNTILIPNLVFTTGLIDGNGVSEVTLLTLPAA